MPARTVIPPPAPPPTRWPGLLVSVGAAVTENERWANGFQFQPIVCGPNEEPPLLACVPGSFDVVAGDPGPSVIVEVDPLFQWEAAKRSTFCLTPGEMKDAAIAKLASSISHKVERELWSGVGAIALGAESQYFQDGTAAEINGGAEMPLVHALARLQYEYGVLSEGATGFIHATSEVASLWFAAGLIVKGDDGKLYDALGNVVVAGSGYPAQSDTQTYAYATGPIGVLLGGVGTVETFDPVNNDHVVIAYQAAAAFYDPCSVVGVNVSLDPCST